MRKNYKDFEPANRLLPAGVSTKWECCKCGWIGTHNESADKTPVVSDMWLLVCPKCGNKDEFSKFPTTIV